MARKFGTSGDQISVPAGTLDNLDPATICVWGNITTWGNGSGNDSQVYTKTTGTAATRQMLLLNATLTSLAFSYGQVTLNTQASAGMASCQAYGLGKALFLAGQTDTVTVGNNRIYCGDMDMAAIEPTSYLTQQIGSGGHTSNAGAAGLLGSNGGGQVVNGNLYIWAIWARTLQPHEIVLAQWAMRDFAASRYIPPALIGGLRIWMPIGLETDWSGLGNNGTLTGAAQLVPDLPTRHIKNVGVRAQARGAAAHIYPPPPTVPEGIAYSTVVLP